MPHYNDQFQYQSIVSSIASQLEEGVLYVDQWFRPSPDPVRPVERFVQTAGESTDSKALTQPISTLWWRPVVDPIIVAALPTQVGEYKIDPDVMVDSHPDWLRQTYELPLPQRRPVDAGYFILDDINEPVSTEWYQPASEPKRLPPALVAEGLSVIDGDILSAANVTTVSQWSPQPSEPVRGRQPLAAEGAFTTDAYWLSEPLVFSWLQQQSEPLIVAAPILSEGVTLSDPDILTQPSGIAWWTQASEPKRTQTPLVATGYFTLDPDTSLEPFLSDWYVQASERPRVRQPLTTEGVTLTDPDVVTEQPGWLQPVSDLVRERQRLVDVGETAIDPIKLTDQRFFGWYQPQSEPVRRPASIPGNDGASLTGQLLVPALSETPDVAEWYQQASEPVRTRQPIVDEGRFDFAVRTVVVASTMEFASKGPLLHFRSRGQ